MDGMKALLSRLHIDPYIAGLLGMVGLASALPSEGLGMTVASNAGSALIAAMFFLQGARLAPSAALAWIGTEAARIDPAQPLPLILYTPPSITRAAALETLERAGRPWRIVC